MKINQRIKRKTKKMAKHSGRRLSKKWIPNGAKRITNANGVRVWSWKEKEYASMRDLIFRYIAPDSETVAELASALSVNDTTAEPVAEFTSGYVEVLDDKEK